MFDGELCELSGGAKSQLLHESVLVKFNGPRRKIQDCSGFLGGSSFSEKLQDLALAGSELC